MLIVARKWNLAIYSILPGAITTSFIVCMPFLWICHYLRTDWLLIASMIVQFGLSMLSALGIILYHFWRDPERTSPLENGAIVSPADGKVIYIKAIPMGLTPIVNKNGRNYSLQELAGMEFTNLGLNIIGVEMNIMNVHVNRCPISGKVDFIKHIGGKFLSLRNTEAPFINTRCTTLITNKKISVATVQIASRLVRRVDNYLNPDQTVELGERLGMIRFGSLVAVIFPIREDVGIEVQIGQTVQAGVTTLAHYLHS
jgi:phosphatidylserine decarboxylase